MNLFDAETYKRLAKSADASVKAVNAWNAVSDVETYKRLVKSADASTKAVNAFKTVTDVGTYRGLVKSSDASVKAVNAWKTVSDVETYRGLAKSADASTKAVNAWKTVTDVETYKRLVKCADASTKAVNAFKTVSDVETYRGLFKSSDASVKAVNAWKTVYDNYKIAFPKGSTAVSIVDATLKTPVIRLDGPHRNFNYPHVNINPRVSGVPDPHLPLPPGSLQVGKIAAKTAKVVSFVNDYFVYIVVAVNAAQIAQAAQKDYNNGTSRNAVEKSALIAAAWGGSFSGCALGGTIGTFLFPGVGTIIGGLGGALAGTIGGTRATKSVFNYLSDGAGYDMEQRKCETCGDSYIFRLYKLANLKVTGSSGQ